MVSRLKNDDKKKAMKKRKKFPKLPNGFGSIRFLGSGRRNPYAVHPPVTEFNLDGTPKTPKALCYVKDWYIGFAVLTAYHNGSYTVGLERDITAKINGNSVDAVLADFNQKKSCDSKSLTFKQVYELYFDDKYVNSKRQYSAQALRSTKAGYKNCSSLHDKIFANLTIDDLQDNLDNCQLKHASLELIKNLYKGMYSYAITHGIVNTDIAKYVKINIPDDDEHGVAFTMEELEIIYNHRDNQTAARIFCMCHLGYRISSYSALKITGDYIIGGNKTDAGKGVLTPLHPSIKPLIEFAELNNINPNTFRRQMYSFLKSVGIPRHTPHDCKHTFSMLCDKYSVHPIARKKMLGHKIDMSNDVYGHWDYDMLLPEVEKIRLPFVTNV